jgi:hypothetical protein
LSGSHDYAHALRLIGSNAAWVVFRVVSSLFDPAFSEFLVFPFLFSSFKELADQHD